MSSGMFVRGRNIELLIRNLPRPETFLVFDFALNRMRLGITKSENGVFDLFLPSAFTVFDFVLNRMRLGIAKY